MLLKQLKELGKSTLKLIELKDTLTLYKLKRRFRSPKVTPVMATASLLGTAGFIWTIPGYFLLRKKKTRLDGLILIGALGFDVFFNTLVTKLFFHRQRPCSKYPEEYMLSSIPVGYSFPSGHALTSFTASTILDLINWRNCFWTLPLATTIAFSRAYLFTHYPSDILVGALGGIFCGTFFYKTCHSLYNQNTFPWINHFIDHSKLFDLLI